MTRLEIVYGQSKVGSQRVQIQLQNMAIGRQDDSEYKQKLIEWSRVVASEKGIRPAPGVTGFLPDHGLPLDTRDAAAILRSTWRDWLKVSGEAFEILADMRPANCKL